MKAMFLNVGEGFMRILTTLAFRPAIGNVGDSGLARRQSAGLPFGIAVIALAVALGVAGTARAENECGEPEAGTPIVCSPSNYDAATDGNIVYRPSEADGADFTIRLTDDLSIRYDRDDPDDDQLTCPLCGDPLYSAVRIETDADHVGDVSLFSSADVTSNARGISVGYYGKSGAMRTEISGGSFSIESDWIRAFAIHSYRGAEFDTNDEFSGDHDLIVRDVVVDVKGGWAGVLGSQDVDGDLNISVQDSDIEVDARWATGVFASHSGTGDVDVDFRNVNIDVSGASVIDGILGYHLGSGNTNIAVRDSSIHVEAEDWSSGGISFLYALGKGGDLSFDIRDVDIDISSIHGIYRKDVNEEGGRYFDGIWGGYWGEEGDIYVDVRRADIVTKGADSGGMSFIHDRKGDIDIAAHDVDIKVEGDRSVGIGGGQRYEGTGDIAIDVQRLANRNNGRECRRHQGVQFHGRRQHWHSRRRRNDCGGGRGQLRHSGRPHRSAIRKQDGADSGPRPSGTSRWTPATTRAGLRPHRTSLWTGTCEAARVWGRASGFTEAAGSRSAPGAASARTRASPCGPRQRGPRCMSAWIWTAAR